jgi:hypothetical protein
MPDPGRVTVEPLWICKELWAPIASAIGDIPRGVAICNVNVAAAAELEPNADARASAARSPSSLPRLQATNDRKTQAIANCLFMEHPPPLDVV